MTMERRRNAAKRALSRRHGMTPDQTEELNRHVAGLDDWRTRCLCCEEMIVGTPAQIQIHAEECRGA
jgi:hypothetical protein